MVYIVWLRHPFSLKDVFNCSFEVVDGINFKLFAIALIYIDDIEDDNVLHIEPILDISKKDSRAFFEEQLKTISL